MRKKKVIIVIGSVSAVLLIGLGIFLFWKLKNPKVLTVWYKDNPVTVNVTDNYDYTGLWENIRAIEPTERSEYLEIPEDLLEKMSTPGLLITCLEYPKYTSVLGYSSYLQGYNSVKEYYNGLRELVSRPDFPETVYNFYLALDYKKVQKSDAGGPVRIIYLDFIMSDPEVASKFTHQQYVELIRRCKENILLFKDKYRSDVFHVGIEGRLLATLLYYDNPEFRHYVDTTEGLKTFVDGESFGIGQDTDGYFKRIWEIVTSYY